MTLDRWDRLPETERAWWLERHRHKEGTHSCGHPRETCADPDHEWFPQLTVCYATRETQAAQAKFEELHKKRPWHDGTMSRWAEERSDAFPYHYQHGTTVWVAATDLGLGGDFLSGASREPEGDHAEPDDGE